MKSFKTSDIFWFVGLLAAVVLSRFIAHDWHFTFVGAGSFLAGYYITNKKVAYAVPFLGLLLTDLVIGFHNQMFEVYACIFFATFLAQQLSGSKGNAVSSTAMAGGMSFISSMVFYIVTNFFSWMNNPMYAQDFSGLMHSYVLALPFFKNQIVADVGFVAAVVLVTQLVSRKVTIVSAQPVTVSKVSNSSSDTFFKS